MLKKYIVELYDENVKSVGGYDWLQLLISVADKSVMVETAIQLLPYTESDLEQVRKEAYEKGVQETKQYWVDAPRSFAYNWGYENGLKKGLNDAWEAARKISPMDSYTRDKVFGLVITSNIFDENTASEAIEKIRRYEQEQEQKQKICIGDEIITTSGLHAICSNIDNIKEGWVYLFFDDGSCGAHKIDEIKKKTGKNYPEIVALLQKMPKT